MLKGVIRGDNELYLPPIEVSQYEKSCPLNYFIRAKEYFKDSRYENAISLLYTCLSINPTDYQAWLWLGMAYEKQQQWENAISAYKNVETILSPSVQNNTLQPVEYEYITIATLQKANIFYENLKNAPEAINHFLRIDEYFDTLKTNSFIKTMSKENEYIIQIIEKHLGKKLNSSYCRLAELHRELDKPKEAEKYLKKLSY